MTTHTVTFNGYAACHVDGGEDIAKTLREQFPNDIIQVVTYDKTIPPLEISGIRQDKIRRDIAYIDELNFVD